MTETYSSRVSWVSRVSRLRKRIGANYSEEEFAKAYDDYLKWLIMPPCMVEAGKKG